LDLLKTAPGVPKPSKILDQAVYIQNKLELIERLKVFNRSTHSTSPKIAEDITQANNLTAKLLRLALGKPVSFVKQPKVKASAPFDSTSTP